MATFRQQLQRVLEASARPEKHPHVLRLQTSQTGEAWVCDGCEKEKIEGGRYQCSEGCDFDYCEVCLANSKETLPQEMKDPVMIMLDFGKSKAYFTPARGFEAVNEENLIAFMDAYAKGNLEKKTVKDI